LAIAAAHDRGRELNLYGTDYPTLDGTCIRDYIHVTDLASAHLAALRFLEGRRGGYAFNLGTGTGVSVREVIASVERVSGHSITVVEQPRRAGDPECLYASPGKARRELGWAPVYENLDAIVSSAVRWHRATQINGAGQLSLRYRRS
jgi:UDP-glucose 4-epimerase